MKSQDERINEILAEWNPIGVDKEIASDEYKGYIPAIINASNNEAELMACLENILNKMEVGYNNSDPLHKKDLREIALKIINIK
jgi:hypothetical protein